MTARTRIRILRLYGYLYAFLFVVMVLPIPPNEWWYYAASPLYALWSYLGFKEAKRIERQAAV